MKGQLGTQSSQIKRCILITVSVLLMLVMLLNSVTSTERSTSLRIARPMMAHGQYSPHMRNLCFLVYVSRTRRSCVRPTKSLSYMGLYSSWRKSSGRCWYCSYFFKVHRAMVVRGSKLGSTWFRVQVNFAHIKSKGTHVT